jgi:methionyl aminopeptidase
VIHYKNEEEREGMRVAGKLAAQTLMMLNEHVKAGVATRKLDELVRDFTHDNGATCATLGYGNPPFPAHCCISVNDVACHGIGSDYELQDGDIVNIDVTSIVDGWHGDTSKMFLIGDVSKEDKELCKVAHEAMWKGIEVIEIGEDIGTIGAAIESYMRDKPFATARQYCGHGIGKGFHEEPQILHYNYYRMGVAIEPGMTFTVEPIINAGYGNTFIDKNDNWTVFTSDRKKSAQWEHTVLVTDDDVQVLTLREEEL